MILIFFRTFAASFEMEVWTRDTHAKGSMMHREGIGSLAESWQAPLSFTLSVPNPHKSQPYST